MPRSPEYPNPDQEWRAPPRPQPEQQANPLVAFLGEHRGGEELSHEEMVSIIRSSKEKERARIGDYHFDPARWMMDQISHASVSKSIALNMPDDTPLGAWPHAKLRMAWDIIALPHYKTEYIRGRAEDGIEVRSRTLGHTITLDPMESKLLDAMAEAVGIPNPFGPVPPEKK